MKNPERALGAFNAPPYTEVGGHRVYEITLGMAGVLEAIGSPFSIGVKPTNIIEWAATLYAMTRPPAESRVKLAAGPRRTTCEAEAWPTPAPPHGGADPRRVAPPTPAPRHNPECNDGDAAGGRGRPRQTLQRWPTAG